MTAPPPSLPWRKRKRTWLALALWLTVAYPVSSWPVDYFYGRGDIPPGGRLDRTVDVLYRPMREVLHGPAGIRPAFRWFVRIGGHFIDLGRRHATPD